MYSTMFSALLGKALLLGIARKLSNNYCYFLVDTFFFFEELLVVTFRTLQEIAKIK